MSDYDTPDHVPDTAEPFIKPDQYDDELLSVLLKPWRHKPGVSRPERTPLHVSPVF
jgi:hypothetical protein